MRGGSGIFSFKMGALTSNKAQMPITTSPIAQTHLPLSSQESRLWLGFAILSLIATLGHFIYPLTPNAVAHLITAIGLAPQLGGHHFADRAAFLGLPNAGDVLSNLPFAIAGGWGLKILLKLPKQTLPSWTSYLLFFVGLLATAIGSGYYHWAPDNNGLLWDRAGMAIAFAGILGLAAGQTIGARAATYLGLATLAASALGLSVWALTEDVLAWVCLQFGGMLLIVGLAISVPKKSAHNAQTSDTSVPSKLEPTSISLYTIIACYALAKIFEANDALIFEWTAHTISGHSLKHLAAAGTAWPVLCSLFNMRRSA